MSHSATVLGLTALLSFAAGPTGPAAAGETPKPRSGSSRWNVAVVVFSGMEILDFAGPAEVFAAAGGGRAYRVYTVGETTRPVVSQGFITITPQYTIDNCPPPDLVVIPGGNAASVYGRPKMMEWVKKESGEAKHLLSVCTGAFVLAKAGLLDGHEATTHHGSIARLRRDFPNVKVREDLRVVDNGKVLTAAGVSAGIDGSLYVVAKMCGQEAAKKTAEYMEYRWQPDATPKSAAAGVEGPERAALEAWFAGDWKRAAEGYRQYVAKQPDDGIAHFRLGMSELGAGHADEAVRSLARAAELGLRDSDTLDQLGRAQLSAKRPADAAKSFERALEQKPGSANTLYNLACCYSLDGQKAKALQALERAFDAGFGAEYAAEDDDLKGLRDDPRFQEMLRKSAR